MECLLVNMQIISLGTKLSHLLSTRCLSFGRRWCGKFFISSCCESAPGPVPPAAADFFPQLDVSIYLMHCGLKVPTSPLSQVLSCQEVYEGVSLHLNPDLCAEGCLQLCKSVPAQSPGLYNPHKNKR